MEHEIPFKKVKRDTDGGFAQSIDDHDTPFETEMETAESSTVQGTPKDVKEDIRINDMMKESFNNVRNIPRVIITVDQHEPIMPSKSRQSFVLCDECLLKSSGKSRGSASCIDCEMYLCYACVESHEGHTVLYDGQDKASKDSMYEVLIQKIKNEKSLSFGKEKEKVRIQDRINVKHALDQEACSIFGMCRMRTGRLVIADHGNSCLKVIDVKNSAVIRYIRLTHTPLFVTEVTQNVKTYQNNLFKILCETFLAVTCHQSRSIIVLDLQQHPVRVVQTIDVEDLCGSLVFHADMYVMVCSSGDIPYIRMVSRDGILLKKLKLEICDHNLSSYLTITLDVDKADHRIFVTSDYDHAVICIDLKGRVVALHTDGKVCPRGLSVDPANGVYLSSWYEKTIYRLSKDLKQMTPITEERMNIKWPRAIVFGRDKLYVSHGGGGLQNTITVMRFE